MPSLGSFIQLQNIPHSASSYDKRRARLIDAILQDLGPHKTYNPDPMKGVDTLSNRRYLIGYQARLQHHHLSLLLGKDPDQSNVYYETSPDLDSSLWNRPRNEPDWKLMPLTRTYFQCQHLLSPGAKQRLESLLWDGRCELAFGGTENHIINRATLVHLIDQVLSHHDSKTDRANSILKNWISQRGKRGFMEFNSPTYHRHAILPLIELHDLSDNADISGLSKSLLDFAFALIALTSLKGVRGGPWHRATRVEEILDKRADIVALVSHLFFGNCELPPVITEGATWATTEYWPPDNVIALALKTEHRGSYLVRQRLDTVSPVLHSTHWVTPDYILGSFSPPSGFVCNYYGSTNRSNLQPWELTFDKPQGSYGPKRDMVDVGDYQNKNVALGQYRNILLIRGEWDYYGTGEFPFQEVWVDGVLNRVINLKLSNEQLVLAIKYDKQAGLGALELYEKKKQALLSDVLGELQKLPLLAANIDLPSISYKALSGVTVCYEDGALLVNGRVESADDKNLVDSPYVRSLRDSGKVAIEYGSDKLELDFPAQVPGWGDGLNAVYAHALYPEYRVERLDQTIDYFWKDHSPDRSIPPGPFTVNWQGWFYAAYGGVITFQVEFSGQISFCLDDKILLKAAVSAGKVEKKEFSFSATLGVLYRIGIHCQFDNRDSKLVVRHKSDHEPFQTMGLLGELFPHQVLSPASPQPGG